MGGRDSRPRPFLLVTLTCCWLALLVTSCGLEPATTPRGSDAWSNGQMVGRASLNNQLGFQLDEWGNGFLAWVDTDRALHLARLDQEAAIVLNRPLELQTDRPTRPQLLLDSAGTLHLSWIDREAAGSQLFYASVSAAGDVVQERVAISPAEVRAAHHVMMLDPAGETIEFFWSDNVVSRPGIYHATLDWSGAVVSPAQLIIEDGLLPAAQVDRHGYLHLAWRIQPSEERTEFYYAIYDPQRGTLGRQLLVTEPIAQMALLGGPTAGVSFDGPWIGLDQTHVYLAWTLEVREGGDVQDLTFYQAFRPPELPVRDPAEPFSYPDIAISAETVHIQGVDPSLTGHLAFLPGQPAEQTISCFTLVAGQGQVETLQIAVVELAPRMVTGQQVVTASRGASVRPSIAMDGQGHLYVAWIDTAGFEQYQVLYAGNAPQVKKVLNRITTYDVVDRVLGVFMTGLSSMIFLPVVVLWMIAPLGYLVLYSMVRSNVDFSQPAGQRTVLIAVGLQLVSKLLLVPSLLDRFPWALLLPSNLGTLFGHWIVPILLSGIAVWPAWLIARRRGSESLLAPYLIFALIDAFLMLIVYVVVPFATV